MITPFYFESPEVAYSKTRTTKFDFKTLTRLKAFAKKSSYKTCRLCLHKDIKEKVHQMVIIHNKSAIIPVHKHLQSEEVISVISGSAELKLFEDNGSVSKQIRLDQLNHIFCCIPRNTFHTLNIKTEWFIFKETILGPFKSNNMVLSSWT